MTAEKIVIEKRLEANLSRIASLLVIYDQQAQGRGRRAVAATDILRAAVMLLHASLEDLVRSLLAWKLPSAAVASLEDIPFAGARTKLTVAELAAERGRAVDSVISDAIAQMLDRASFNNRGELARALRRLGLPDSLLAAHQGALGAMMQRRHLIAHRADANDALGSGHHLVRSLNRTTVSRWSEAVSRFGEALLRNF